MSSVRGNTPVLTRVRALRDHRERLRALEATPGGAGPDGPWTTITSFLNGWTDASVSIGAIGAPVSYMIDRHNLVHLRGRLINQASSPQLIRWDDNFTLPGLYSPAFTLPVGFRPASVFEAFVGDGGDLVPAGAFGNPSSGIGHVGVFSTGDVVAMMMQTGFGTANPNATFPQMAQTDGVALLTNEWRNADGIILNTSGTNIFGYRGGSGFGIVAGHSITATPPGALYLAVGPFADQQLTVRWRSADSVALGLRCQDHQFFPAVMPRPAGYWLMYQANGDFDLYFQDGRGLHEVSPSTPFNTGPAKSDGDFLGFRVHNWQLQVLDGPVSAQTVVASFAIRDFGSGFSTRLWGSGRPAIGVSGTNVAGVPLIDQPVFGLGLTHSICLDGISFEAA